MRRHIYSRFRPVRVYRDEESVITCTAFYNNNRLLAGSHDGDVKIFDIETTSLVSSWQCHGTARCFSSQSSAPATIVNHCSCAVCAVCA
jgi:WD40 repeat protein